MTGNVPAGFDASLITVFGVMYNLVWATLSNIVGGAGFVGFTYWMVYHKSLGVRPALPSTRRQLVLRPSSRARSAA